MEDYFKKNKELILQLANTEAGRFLLGLKDKDRIVGISPNSVHQLKDFQNGKSIIRAKFWACDNVAQIFLPTLTKIEIAQAYEPIKDKYEAFLHFSGLERNRKYPQIYLVTTDFISGAGDGYIRNSGANWSTVQSAGSGVSLEYASTNMDGPFAGLVSGTYYIDRVFLPFDTSSLGLNATITAATLTVYVFGGVNNADSSDVRIVQTSQASTSSLVLDDFDQVGGVSGGSKALVNFTNNANNTIDLNSTGLTYISKTGFTKIGLRVGRDIDNQAPTGSNQLANLNPSEAASNRPTLQVTYTLPGGVFLHNFL